MPAVWSNGLAVLGILFGITLLVVASPWRPLSTKRQKIGESLLILGLSLGGLLLLGIVAGVYRACSVCVLIWASVVASCLAVIAAGGQGGRAITVLLGVLTAAAAWTRYDRTTAEGLASLLPHTELSLSCVADVLTKGDLHKLRTLGAPDGVPLIVVAHCSPCASATVARLANRTPSAVIVAADSTLAPVVGKNRLIVFPELSRRTAKLGANLYQITLKGGEVIECKSNINSAY